MTHEIIFELKNVTFNYSKTDPILKGVDLQIKHGKLIAIAGPNGCGKTTLVKLFNGLHKPATGTILFKGRPIDKHEHLTEHVGIVFQNPDEQVFFPKVDEDIAFGLRNLRVPEDEISKRLDNVLNTLKINKLRHKSFFNLSFGEKKKVAFAGVLVISPDIIVLDEPTIGLDPWSRTQFFDLIIEMKKHSTLIVVTHDIELLKLVDEIHFLWGGVIKDTYTDFKEFERNMFSINPNEDD